ncbi:hypothetical protein SZN_37893, partial [Streptomyces zinciresistens K42]
MTVAGERTTAGSGPDPRPDRALPCARAALLALAGSVPASLGHRAPAAVTVPWRLVAVFTVIQSAVVRRRVRRTLSLPVAARCPLAARGGPHPPLTPAGGGPRDGRHTGPPLRGHAVTA